MPEMFYRRGKGRGGGGEAKITEQPRCCKWWQWGRWLYL